MDLPDLDQRQGLPDALRVLLAEHPRRDWTGHANFDGLVSFWLDRHLRFRQLLTSMRGETEALLDRRSAPADFAARLSRQGRSFVHELHGHHQIEDQHFFPLLAQKETRISRGFDMLEADHQVLDRYLDGFIQAANGALQQLDDRPALQTSVGLVGVELTRLERLIDRHLEDEEDLVVPVILRHGAGSFY